MTHSKGYSSLSPLQTRQWTAISGEGEREAGETRTSTMNPQEGARRFEDAALGEPCSSSAVVIPSGSHLIFRGI